MKYCVISTIMIVVVLSISAPGHAEPMPAPGVSAGTAVIPATRPTCAILTLDAKGGLSAEECGLLTDRFMIEFDRIGQYRLLPRSKMSEVLKMQEFSRSENCSASECAVEAGKLLSVQYMVYGSVGKIGNTYTLNTFMVNVESGEAEKRATTDHEGRIDDLLKLAMALNARQLLGLSTETETRPVARVAVQPLPNRVEEVQTEPVRTVQPLPRSLNKELLLWSRLESEDDIKRSSVGPGGKMNGGRFVPGRFGNGIELNMNEQYGVTFPAETVAGPDGCIEFWAKLVDFPNDLAWGARPALLSGDDGKGAQHFIMLHLNGNDGQSNGGLIADIPGLANGATGQYGQWTYARALGADSAGDWHHYAMVWASAGIQGVNNGKRTVAAYVDGKLNSSIWRGVGGNIRPVVPATGRFGLLWHSGMQGGSVVFDNLKVWNYAKTDFSDRTDEMKNEMDRVPAPKPFPASLRKGLVLHYAFDKDDDGKVTDISGKGYTGEVRGAKWTTKGKVGGAYDFNGNGDYIDTGYNLSGMDEISVCGWVLPARAARGASVVTQFGGPASDNVWALFAQNDSSDDPLPPYRSVAGVLTVDGKRPVALGKPTQIGQWTHLCFTFKRNGKLVLYKDGVAMNRDVVSDSPLNKRNSTAKIGASIGGDCYWANGLIDEVMIYNRELTEEEVKQIYDGQK